LYRRIPLEFYVPIPTMASKIMMKTKQANNPYDVMSMEELFAQLTPEEIEQLNNEVDPDNTLLPPSQRCKDQTTKASTAPFDREKLLQYIEEASRNEEDWEKNKPFVKAIRGKRYEPKLMEQKEPKEVSSPPQTALHIDLDMDEDLDELLKNASEEDLIDLAAVLGFTGLLTQEQIEASLVRKPQIFGGFHTVAKPSTLKILPDEAPNTTNVEESIRRLAANDASLHSLNLNNIPAISNDQFDRLWSALEHNVYLHTLLCANTQLTNIMAEGLLDVVRKNRSLKILNLESNTLTGEYIVKLLHAINYEDSRITEVRLCNQRQHVLGIQVEQEIAKKVAANPHLLRLGVDLVTVDAQMRIQTHLTENLDRHTRVKRRSKSQER
jgi:tropomodulin